MRHIDYAVERIQNALMKVNNDRFTPAALSPRLTDYLIDLTVKYPQDLSSFSKFVISLPGGAIEQELLRQVIPLEHRQRIEDGRLEHERLALMKEHAIEQADLDKARDCRDQQEQVWRSIQALIAGAELIVTPETIESSLESLGGVP